MSKTPPNPLLDHKSRGLSAGVIVVVVLVLALGAGGGVQYWRGHSTVLTPAGLTAAVGAD